MLSIQSIKVKHVDLVSLIYHSEFFLLNPRLHQMELPLPFTGTKTSTLPQGAYAKALSQNANKELNLYIVSPVGNFSPRI